MRSRDQNVHKNVHIMLEDSIVCAFSTVVFSAMYCFCTGRPGAPDEPAGQQAGCRGVVPAGTVAQCFRRLRPSRAVKGHIHMERLGPLMSSLGVYVEVREGGKEGSSEGESKGRGGGDGRGEGGEGEGEGEGGRRDGLSLVGSRKPSRPLLVWLQRTLLLCAFQFPRYALPLPGATVVSHATVVSGSPTESVSVQRKRPGQECEGCKGRLSSCATRS